jgi:hypothetical protein
MKKLNKRESGKLRQIGNFKGNKKYGNFTRWDKDGMEEYNEDFDSGKLIKKKYP